MTESTAPQHPSRDLASARTRDVPRDFLQSLFVCELMVPSKPLWIVSPWISNVVLLDNSARQFAPLNPGWPLGPIRLVEILLTLLDRGGSIRIITNKDDHNQEFIAQTRELRERHPENFGLRSVDALHTKGIVGDRFSLEGSMNLTFNGVNWNEEHLIYRTDPRTVQERRLTLSQQWDHQPAEGDS